MSYASNIGATPVIDDSNCGQYFDPVVNGIEYGKGRVFEGEGYSAPAGVQPWPHSNMSRAELIEVIKYNEANACCTRDVCELLGVRIKNQKQTPLCWAFAALRALEIELAKAGQFVEPLSPASCAALITGWNYRGGYAAEIVDFLIKTGASYSRLWADTSFDRSNNTAEANAVRHLNRIVEAYRLETGNLDQRDTALAKGFTVLGGIPSWGHEIDFEDLRLMKNGNIEAEFANSWTEDYGDNGRGILTRQQCRGADLLAIKIAKPS